MKNVVFISLNLLTLDKGVECRRTLKYDYFWERFHSVTVLYKSTNNCFGKSAVKSYHLQLEKYLHH